MWAIKQSACCYCEKYKSEARNVYRRLLVVNTPELRVTRTNFVTKTYSNDNCQKSTKCEQIDRRWNLTDTKQYNELLTTPFQQLNPYTGSWSTAFGKICAPRVRRRHMESCEQNEDWISWRSVKGGGKALLKKLYNSIGCNADRNV